MSLASTWVPKLPLVTTLTMSNTFMTVTMSVVTTTPMVVAICGRVTRQKTCDVVAPSTRAASMISSGTALIAAEKITIAKPAWIQIRITISHMLLNGCSWMNPTGLAVNTPCLFLAIPPTPPLLR